MSTTLLASWVLPQNPPSVIGGGELPPLDAWIRDDAIRVDGRPILAGVKTRLNSEINKHFNGIVITGVKTIEGERYVWIARGHAP